jgi:hypothetical protein
MPKLRTLHQGGAHPARPKHTWSGYRPPRSARRQWEDTMNFLRFRKAHQAPALKLPEPEPCQEPECLAAASHGLVFTPWQHALMHKLAKEENVA